jgi:hypothetical protein
MRIEEAIHEEIRNRTKLGCLCFVRFRVMRVVNYFPAFIPLYAAWILLTAFQSEIRIPQSF